MGGHLHVPVGLRVRLTPAVDALVGLYLDEAEVLSAARIREEVFDVGYLHRLSPVGGLLGCPPAVHYQFAAGNPAGLV